MKVERKGGSLAKKNWRRLGVKIVCGRWREEERTCGLERAGDGGKKKSSTREGYEATAPNILSIYI